MSQYIIWGIDNLGILPPVQDGKKVMLVADASFPHLNIHNKVEQSLHAQVLFDNFSSNPLYEDVVRGVELFEKNGCDAIVAVGGGSCIDVAKCIKLFSNLPHGSNYLQAEWTDSGIPLIAIPTTAGTGSESTRYAVIYHEGTKQSISHPSIIPNYAILEPEVLLTLPIYQKKCTLLDALCQGIESWWSINSTELSIYHSTFAVSTIIENMENYLNGGDMLATRLVMDAANRAGQAICITQTTAPHAFSYKLTSIYGLPHGHAVAVCLPAIWHYMLSSRNSCVDARGWDHVQKVFDAISQTMHCYCPQEAIDWFQSMLTKFEINYPTSKDRERELNLLTESVNPIRLKNSPVAIDRDAAYNIYNSILQ